MERYNLFKKAENFFEDDYKFLSKNFDSQIDLSIFGKFLGSGVEHRVYGYGENEVIKIPIKNPLYKQDAVTAYENQEIGKKNFGKYFVETDVVINRDEHIMIQRRLEKNRPFQKDDLENFELKKQFEEILSINSRLIKEGIGSLDLFGLEGFMNSVKNEYNGKKQMAEISNIIVEQYLDPETSESKSRLVLPDIDFQNFGNGGKTFLDNFINSVNFLVQKYSLKRYFGYEIT